MTARPEEQRNWAEAQSARQRSNTIEAALRAAVSERLGRAKFGLWFGDGVRLGLSGDGNALEVQVPDRFFREWIESHYTTSLIEAAEVVVGRRLQISVQIHSEVELSSGNVVASGLARNESDLEHWHSGNTTIPLLTNPPVSPSFPSSLLDGTERSLTGGADVLTQADQQHSPKQAQSICSVRSFPSDALQRRSVRRLDNFVTGPGNSLAHAAACEMAQSAAKDFNPLVIYGAIGLGKTHLLEGISYLLKQAHPNLQIVQITAEAFTNSFLESMRTGSLNGFRVRFRNAGGLVVDDVHFLAAKRATMIEFLYTFNTLIDKGVPIILAADQHPRLISRLTDELTTRFLGGMVVKIEPPDLATRRLILQERARVRGVNVPEAVVSYIAEHLRTNIRELEGALHTVIAQAVLTGKRLDLNLAKTALHDTIRHTVQTVALRDVERTVCQLFQVSSEVLKSDSRARTVAYPRMLAMYLARKHIGVAYTEIGRYFGGRNHSTVISALRKVEGWLRAEQRSGLLPGFETVADVLADLERTLRA
jgi:chromosomal replication initiator protein